jgi:hypothetical protein
VDSDLVHYGNLAKQICNSQPNLEENYRSFGRAQLAITNGTFTGDLSVFAQDIQNVITLYQQYVINEVNALSTLADIHSAMGDLNQPKKWDLSGTPIGVCANSDADGQPGPSKN